jgi:ketosteroid isomerase-like protein
MDFPNKAKVPPLLQPYAEAWGNQDAEALAACFEEACEFVSPLLDHPLKGRSSVRAYLRSCSPRFRRSRPTARGSSCWGIPP